MGGVGGEAEIVGGIRQTWRNRHIWRETGCTIRGLGISNYINPSKTMPISCGR